MNRRFILLAVAVWLGAFAPAAADCPAPTLSVSSDVAPGEVATVEGAGWLECRDVGGACSRIGTSSMSSPLRLTLERDGTTVVTQDVTPDDDGRFVTELRVPADLPPDVYDVVVSSGATVESTQLSVD